MNTQSKTITRNDLLAICGKSKANSQIAEVKLSFRYRAGVLVRNKIRFELEAFCAKHNLKINIIESRGLFGSEYYVEISGSSDRVKASYKLIEEWFIELDKEING